MKGTRPLTTQEIDFVKSAFTGANATRNKTIFMVGINTGFRISEILTLTRADVVDKFGNIVNHIELKRKYMKGKKAGRIVYLNQSAKDAISELLLSMQAKGLIFEDDFLFRSLNKNKPIDRVQAYRVLTDTFKRCRLSGKLATHTMRKTFANQIYQYFQDKVAAGAALDPFRLTSKALGHADINSTDKYLAFNASDIELAIDNLG